MINPIELFKMIGNNPKNFVISQMKQNSNPVFQSLIETAEKGDIKSLENFARNMCKERGINYDEQFSEFMKNYKR